MSLSLGYTGEVGWTLLGTGEVPKEATGETRGMTQNCQVKSGENHSGKVQGESEGQEDRSAEPPERRALHAKAAGS
jgi:hypothetical protein